MPFQKLTMRSGINSQATPTQNEGGFSSGSLVRFHQGAVQPVGGWATTLDGAFLGGKFAEAARGGWMYQLGSLANPVAAFGTANHLYYVNFISLTVRNAAAYEITPDGLSVGYVSAYDAAVAQDLRCWALDNWGDYLVALPRDGAPYSFLPGTFVFTLPDGRMQTRLAPVQGKATLIPNAPTSVRWMLVGMPERHLICLGSNTAGGLQDPLLVRWSDVEDFTSWTATANNSAGSFRLSSGSTIVSGKRGQNEHLIWTDTGLWSMRFLGLPYVYGFDEKATGCGLVGPNAAVAYNGTAYWMTNEGFCAYAGTVRPLPCAVLREVFDALDLTQISKVCAGVNSQFNEVLWCFPTTSGECDMIVAVDVTSGDWRLDKIPRSTWLDAPQLHYPLAASPDGYLYRHEFGTDAVTGATTTPHPSYIQTGMMDIGDGEAKSFVDQVIPDMEITGGPVNLTVLAQDFPGGPVRSKGPFAIAAGTQRISPRIRGRQIGFRVETASLGTTWRWGATRIRIAEDGR